ncbi:unnamed protein product, partial [Brassica rapa]
MWVSVSTHWTSVCVRQHTQDVSGCACVSVCDVRGCPPAHTGRPWLFVAVRQHTHDVRGCPSAHTGRLWDVCGCPCVSVSTHRTFVAVRVCSCVSVCVRQHTHDIRGCPSVHISARWSLDSARWPFLWTVRVILALVGCLFSTHRTSVGVHQHTQDVRGCPCVSVCVRLCPSAHTGRRLWLSISTHISTLVLGLCTLALPVDSRWPFPWTVWVILAHVGCLFSTHRTSVGVRQHTQDDVRRCPPAHTGRPWLSVCVRLCP